MVLCGTKGKRRVLGKTGHSLCVDLIEILRNEWTDDVNIWPDITHIHLGVYLLLTSSLYSKEDLLHYKSLTATSTSHLDASGKCL